jgi:protein TonB
MSAAALPAPKIRPIDRLSMTVFFAAILHALVILGITFSAPEDTKTEELPGLEVTLVTMKTDKKQDKADFLAQASQEGSGQSKEIERPTTPAPAFVPTEEPGDTPEQVLELVIPRAVEPEKRELLTAEQSRETAPSAVSPSEVPNEENLTAAQLVQRSMEIARLSAEIDQSMKVFANQPRKKFITASTKEYKYAAYEESWRAKVERIGTLNFPDEARRRQLSGSLRMSVTIEADGGVSDVKITKSSGQRVLDDAAIRIVRLAAPFAPFPAEVRAETDQLVILRTWIFEAGQGSFTQQ